MKNHNKLNSNLKYEEMEFVPKSSTETDPDTIKKIKSFQQKIGLRALAGFNRL